MLSRAGTFAPFSSSSAKDQPETWAAGKRPAQPRVGRAGAGGRGRRRRGMILASILVLIGLLALAVGSYVFFVQAEAAGVSALADQQQARLAAESGLEEVTAVLRAEGHNVRAWFDVPQRWRHALVWGEGFDRESDPVRKYGSRKELLEPGSRPPPAWRYSMVAPAWDQPPGTIRFGLTPESARLNVNNASPEQLAQLMTPLLGELGIENPQDLINALLDWREPGSRPRPGGARDEYYNTLKPPYNCKGGPLDTVEEMLLIRGFSAAVLYGEDVNRNGILDANEDDGEASFPEYDNADGVLNPGLAPFLTVYSRELDTALDNKPRINLNGDAASITAQIAQLLPNGELSDATIAFIAQLKQQNFNFARLASPADLYVGAASELPSEEGEEGPPPIPPELGNSPVTLEELPWLMDRFSTRPAQQANQPIVGLININAAPARVLAVIPGMPPQAVAAIISTRATLEAEQLRTTAWPLVAGAVDAATFRRIAPHITTKVHQFHVEIVGYSDHNRVSRRLEWLIEMIGPLAQVRYTRDLTNLGLAWPVDEDTVVTTLR